MYIVSCLRIGDTNRPDAHLPSGNLSNEMDHGFHSHVGLLEANPFGPRHSAGETIPNLGSLLLQAGWGPLFGMMQFWTAKWLITGMI